MGQCILVVDDDDTIRELICMALEDEGYTTAVAHHGLEALAVTRRKQVDLILLDMRMPVMDGWGFARAYRESPGPHAPIVVLTAGRSAAETAAQISAADYMAKPFELDHLLAVVAQNVEWHGPRGTA